LIGYNLYYIYYTKDIETKTKSIYLVLVLGYNNNSRIYNKPKVTEDWDLFFKSLKLYIYIGPGKRFFPETGITFNVCNAIYNSNYTTISQLRRLVSCKLGGLYSAYQYWIDSSFKVQTIKPIHIIGIRRALTKKNISNIVGLV
jgi:hypothetical protein